MSARYWVLISDHLYTDPGLQLPTGLRLVSPPGPQAGPELDGQRVLLFLRLDEDGQAVIERAAGRQRLSGDGRGYTPGVTDG
jgi:hypothetical protein